MQRLILSLLLIATVLLCRSASDTRAEDAAVTNGMRTWHSVGGSEVEAEFVKIEYGQVYLKSSEDKVMKIALSQLVSEDREVARALGEAVAPERKAPPWMKEKTAQEKKIPTELVSLFGDTLVKANGKPCNISELGGAEKIGIYFSAHWCPPCRAFTPKLVDAYNSLKKDGKPFEVVFVSSDRDQKGMQNYMRELEMPWYAIPFDSQKRSELKQKYAVSGIPYLVVVGADGKTLSTGARGEVGAAGAGAYEKW